MHVRENLKLLHDHFDEIVTAAHNLTPEQTAEVKAVMAGQKAASVKGNPLIDLLLGLLTDPAKLQNLLAIIMTIINLIPKKP